MTRKIITGIDVGTHSVRVVIAEQMKGENLPRIIGMGHAESRGLRHGYIININDAARSIGTAIKEAERSAGVSIKEAFLSIGGIGLEGVHSYGSVIISRADSEITDTDVERTLKTSEEKLPSPANKRIIHTIPIEYRIDGSTVLGRPSGMKGLKLEVKTLLITSLDQHLNDIIRTVEHLGVEVVDVMAAPVAASFVALSKAQKMAGCILTNIGAETMSISIFEEGIPISLQTFPIGSTDITNDIALGLKIPLEEAEQIKLGKTKHQFPKKKLDEIVESRLEDIFELISSHLKKVGKDELLPAGIVLTGGGSGIETIEDFARASTHLPSKIPSANFISNPNSKKQIKDSTWFVAYGLCIFGANSVSEGRSPRNFLGGFRKKITSLVKQVLP